MHNLPKSGFIFSIILAIYFLTGCGKSDPETQSVTSPVVETTSVVNETRAATALVEEAEVEIAREPAKPKPANAEHLTATKAESATPGDQPIPAHEEANQASHSEAGSTPVAGMRAYRDPATGIFVAPSTEQLEAAAKKQLEATAKKEGQQHTANQSRSTALPDETNSDEDESSVKWIKSPVDEHAEYFLVPRGSQAPLKAEIKNGQLEISH